MRVAMAGRNGGKWVCLSVALATAALADLPANAAQIVYVDGGGDCEGNAPCFTTVQAGVNNADAPGDEAEVRIFPGTYNESATSD